ncbi:hypothetical protein BJX68DRAFT_206343 [Aspergillus pseudodeflectus]|uniref:Uncharacterized protein n=1 Tax=Aspergillus pseudodeflectus TaxID=176178 RepID=A0ABR4KVI5_9EURO
MDDRASSSSDLDPSHTSCIGGRMVLTCPSCAGNAPRTSACTNCSGRGFNMFVCTHCSPAAAMSCTSAATSVFTSNNQLAPNPVQQFGDRDGGSGGEGVVTNSRAPRGS